MIVVNPGEQSASKEVSVETTSLEPSDEDWDEYDFSKEELAQKKKDDENACSNMVEAEAANETYLCIDLENKKQMNHFMVRPTGGTIDLYCHAKGGCSIYLIQCFLLTLF